MNKSVRVLFLAMALILTAGAVSAEGFIPIVRDGNGHAMYLLRDVEVRVVKGNDLKETWGPAPTYLNHGLDQSLLFASGNLVLTEDIVITGDVRQVGGTLDLNGHRLLVEGSFQQLGGVVLVNKGELEIGGDFRMAPSYGGQYDPPEMKLMNDEDRLTVHRGFSIDQSAALALEKGLMEIQGDFSVGMQNIRKEAPARILLNGTGRQLMTFGAPLDAQIEIRNPDVAWGNDDLFRGNLLFFADVTVPQNFLFSKGTFDLNGHTLTIEGDLTQVEGHMVVNGGQLTVNGNYTVGMIDDYSIYDKDGAIEMHSAADRVLVVKDFITQGKMRGSWALSGGVIEVKGDVLLRSQDFSMQDQVKLLLSGDREQHFSMTHPETTSIGILELLNDQILFDDPDHLTVANEGKGMMIRQLIPHRFVVPNLTVGLEFQIGGDMTVSGNVVLDGSSLHLNGHALTMNGSLTSRSGQIDFDGGRLSVGSDFISVQDENGNDYMPLWMNTTEAQLKVNGNFNADVTVEGRGLIEVKGDFAKRIYHTLAGPTEDLRVLLSGSAKQTVGGDITAEFLELANTSGEGVHFADNFRLNIKKLFNHHKQAVFPEGSLSFSSFPDYDEDGLRDPVDPDPLIPAEDVLNLTILSSSVRNQVVNVRPESFSWNIRWESIDGIVIRDHAGNVVARCKEASMYDLFFEPVTTGMQENQTYRLIIPKDIIRVNEMLKNKAYDLEFTAQGDVPPPSEAQEAIDLFDLARQAKVNPGGIPNIIQQYGQAK